MADRLIQYDGIKTSLWGGIEDGWVISGHANEQSRDVQAFYKSVPWLFRGVSISADSLSSMPFALVKGTVDYDTSQDWKNKVGFMPKPTELLWLIEASLMLTGRAYLWREYNALKTRSLRYIAPTSVQFEYKQGNYVFKRDLNDGTGPREVDPRAIVPFWMRDPYVEIGPPLSYPAQAALSACGVLFNMDAFIAAFFKRGAIKTTIFQAEGMGAADREEFLTWWNKLVTGIGNAFKTKILNAKAMTPVVIGEGIEALQNIELTDDKKKDISVALGIPVAILFSESANFATAQQDKLNLYDSKIVPDCRFIENVLNDQIFTPLGLRFEFREETLDIYQQDESDRSQAVSAFIDFLTKCPTADIAIETMKIYGFEYTPELEKAILEWYAGKEEKADELQERMTQPAQPEQTEQPPVVPQPEEDKALKSELSKWERKAIKAFKAGKSAAVPFVFTCEVDRSLVDDISDALEAAASEDEVKAAFEMTDTKPAIDIGGLIDELKNVRLYLKELDAKAEAKAEPAPPPVINISVPEQPAPIVTVQPPNVIVNIPEQPAPVVNVKFPAEKQSAFVVKRDRDGRILGIEET